MKNLRGSFGGPVERNLSLSEAILTVCIGNVLKYLAPAAEHSQWSVSYQNEDKKLYAQK